MKQLLSGNEAIALGAYHAGVKVATAYPGTPSTEILENMARFDDVYAEWSPNEKVAMEVGLGAAYGGVRVMVSMKQVGLNVAADPFFAAAITGTVGGLVVVSCDDPGVHSSQGEQDNRHYARFAKVPMLEPTDSQDAYDILEWAFKISEEFDTPVLVRSTTRIAHCKTVVDVNRERKSDYKQPVFKRDVEKMVMVPSYARTRRFLVEERIAKLGNYFEEFPMNEMLLADRKLGVISSGVAYQYAREVFKDASHLKLVSTYPLPVNLIRRFAGEVERLIVVEELDPFLEDIIKTLGISVTGKEFVPITGELNNEILEQGAIKAGILKPSEKPEKTSNVVEPELPKRPPLLCAGCPHIATEYTLGTLGLRKNRVSEDSSQEKKPGLIVTGDIGCYGLGVYAPLFAYDTSSCMGASIGEAIGLEKAGIADKTLALIGDSTFIHSGVTGLIDLVYKQGKTTVVILDNETTAMTGHQDHPGTGKTASGKEAPMVKIEDLVRGVGIKDVAVISAFDLKAIKSNITRCIETDAPSVLIIRGDCPLHLRKSATAYEVDTDACNGCHLCLRIGCPAMSITDDKAYIDPVLCMGSECSICAQVCPRNAIGESKK
jgi:indolepyruvate ferredoxin oxidoreductase alpha subunit